VEKQKILDALDLAMADHKAFAGSATDWDFVSALGAAKRIVEAAPEVLVPEALAQQAAA
jgi:hypothetical protein